MSRPIDLVGVIVPAHDEEDLLPSALQALARAAGLVRHAGVRVDVVVVADACGDATANATRAAGVRVIEVNERSVGPARAAGFKDVLRRHAHVSSERLWLATTDADSLVPPEWLAEHLGHAATGADLVLGTVDVVDWSGHPPHVESRWRASYARDEGHRHVHGANVGARASAYCDVGGFLALEHDEDVALAAALQHRRVVRTGAIPVVTSARRRARARGGFADHLLGLA